MYDVTFIKKFESTVRKLWNDAALNDYKHPVATYGQLAAQIEADQLLWKAAGINKGDKIALNAKSCAGWIKTFMAVMTGGFVGVRLFDGYTPTDTMSLVNHSDSVLLYTEKRLMDKMDFEQMPNLKAAIGEKGKYKMKSVGEIVSEGIECRIDSTDPEHIPGEVIIKGDCVFTGYYKNPEATAEVLDKDSWFRTGDMGTIDKDNTVFLAGRCKNMLLSANGQNIFPEEIEVVLNTLSYVQESIIVDRKGHLTALIVPNLDQVGASGMDNDALNAVMEGNIAKLNQEIPAYSHVDNFELKFEPFVKTPKGSIRRFMYK